MALSQVCDPLFQRNYCKVPNVTHSKLQGLDPSTDEFTLADILISTLFSKNKRTKNKQTGFQERALFYLSCQLRREIISPVAMRGTQNQLRAVTQQFLISNFRSQMRRLRKLHAMDYSQPMHMGFKF